jgi:SM-20-related protein
MKSDESKFEPIIESILANGYGVCDNFFDKKEVDLLINFFVSRYNSGIFKKAGVGEKQEEQVLESIRGDKILWLENDNSDQTENLFFEKIDNFIQYLNQTCYLGIKNSEFHLAKYAPGKFYKKHKDSFEKNKGRVLSIIVYLNINWRLVDGGNLLIFSNESNNITPITINPIAGRMVCFESDKMKHEVEITNADRLSITGWLLNK